MILKPYIINHTISMYIINIAILFYAISNIESAEIRRIEKYSYLDTPCHRPKPYREVIKFKALRYARRDQHL